MAVWKRAVLYLSRKRGRTILLVVLMFAMACFIMVGISLKNSADKEIINLRKNLGTGFVLEADIDNEVYYKTADTNYSSLIYAGPKITPKMIEQILSVDGVTDYSIDSLVQLVYTNLELRPGLWAIDGPDEYDSIEKVEVKSHSTWIWPCSNGELQRYFRTGAITISSGRNIQEGDRFKAVISESLAQKNGVSVGDTFTVETKEGNFRLSDSPSNTWGVPVELEIVGVFRMNFTQATSEYTPECGYMENNIYSDLVTNDVLEENLTVMYPKDEDYLKVTFFVEEPDRIEEIMQQVRTMDEVNVNGLLLSVDNTAYKAAAKPYEQIRIFATILLASSTIGIGVILYLVMRLWVQGRMHEAGILLSLGIGRRKIIGQMLLESLIAAVAALMLSLVLSGIIVDKCKNLAEQVTAPKEGVEAYDAEVNYWSEPVVNQVSAEKVELEYGVSGYEVILMIVLVCGVSSVSVLLAAIKITDIEPMRLLSSM